MPDGEMRRPPQLWEQRLARQTAILSVGISSNGDATAIVPPTPTPGTDGGIEPAPVLPPPGDFIAPSQPTLLKQVQAINVLWDGLNSSGDLWPYDTSWVEIHMSTTSGFSPSSTTLKGRLARPGIYSVGGLSSGTTYYFKLRGADPAGNVTDASAQASSTTGSATSSDIISISADKVTAGTVTGLYIAGGTIAGGYLSGGTISGGYITGGTLNAGYINGGTVNSALVSGGTITGSRFSTSSGSSKISIVDNSSTPAGTVDAIEFYQSSSVKAYMASVSNGVSFYADYVYFANNANTAYSNVTTGDLTSTGDLDVAASVDLGYSGVNRAFRVNASGDVLSLGIQAATTGDAANVRVATGTGGQLLRSTSSARYKDQLAPLSTDLSGVDADKLADFGASVDPYDVLALTPTEFRSLAAADDEARLLGFIAEDVAAKFPWAAEWNEADQPDAVKDRPILAALLSVVKDQQAAISDLRARIEALEA